MLTNRQCSKCGSLLHYEPKEVLEAKIKGVTLGDYIGVALWCEQCRMIVITNDSPDLLAEITERRNPC